MKGKSIRNIQSFEKFALEIKTDSKSVLTLAHQKSIALKAIKLWDLAKMFGHPSKTWTENSKIQTEISQIYSPCHNLGILALNWSFGAAGGCYVVKGVMKHELFLFLHIHTLRWTLKYYIVWVTKLPSSYLLKHKDLKFSRRFAHF